MTSRETYERNLRTARGEILVVAVLSVINVLTVLAKQDFFFYFSASVPFYLALFFAEICGMRSEAFYEEFYGPGEYAFYDASIFYVVFVVALLLAALYFLFWFMSRKSRGWALATLIVYSLDLVGHLFFCAFIYGFDLTDVLVLLFHALVIYSMVQVVRAWNGIQSSPTQAEIVAAADGMPYGEGAAPFGPGQPAPETQFAGEAPASTVNESAPEAPVETAASENAPEASADAVSEGTPETPAEAVSEGAPETPAAESAEEESTPKAD